MINCIIGFGVNQRQQKEPKMGAIKKGQGQKTVKKAKFTNMLTQTCGLVRFQKHQITRYTSNVQRPIIITVTHYSLICRMIFFI